MRKTLCVSSIIIMIIMSVIDVKGLDNGSSCNKVLADVAELNRRVHDAPKRGDEGEFKQAMKDMERFIDEHPDLKKVLEDLKEKDQEFEKHKSVAQEYRKNGQHLEAIGEYQECLDVLTQMSETTPQNEKIGAARANIFWDIGKAYQELANENFQAARSEENVPSYMQDLFKPQSERLLSEDSRTRDQAVDSILQDRRDIVDKLIPLVDPANDMKYSDETRSAAAYLLGEFRASEAVPILSRALADEPGAKIISRISRYDISRYDVPVWTALVKIGRPTVPAMIENIETSDNRILRKKSLDVLNHVLGGKRRLLELLSKLQKKATDKEKHRRITVAQQFAEVHFKEDKEPLY